MRPLVLSAILFLTVQANAPADIDASFAPPGWQQFQGDHFVVLCPPGDTQDFANDVLNHAEDYYHDIADDIGYSRYRNFWTWNDRVKIVLFQDQAAYVRLTGKPAWSGGFASEHSRLFKTRVIVSYKGQPNFINVILPHEITHLILHDFIGFGRPVPRFFDEGVAQLEQKDDSLQHMDVMARMILEGKIIPLSDLPDFDLMAHQNDPQIVSIFYVESLYIVDFLVKTYGKDSFKELCRHLRDGEDFRQALKSSYYPTLDSMRSLQEKWVEYAKQYFYEDK
ncbi:MAG: hypothetical protein KGK03_02440 [Candidatus Omnitrophica bacterium]|nr:hypothetical protein [Candidatus Omnitrophota bacterium]MDE2221908.1 hypothetical protein [Candidatus Omnitrophota bacterium]